MRSTLRNTIKWRIAPNEFNKKISIPNLDLVTCMDSSAAYVPQQIHTHEDLLEFHYLHKGFQAYRIDSKMYYLKSGDVYVTFPGQMHGSDSIPMGRNTIYYLRIYMKTARNFLGYSANDAHVIWQALNAMKKQQFRGNDTVRDDFERIFSFLEKKNSFVSILVRNAVTELLVRFIELEQVQTQGFRSSEIQKIVKDLHTDYHLSLQDAANLTNLSISRFQHRFRDEVGISFSEYKLRKRIETAIGYFYDETKNITDIAMELGFYSSQQFSSQFKKITGIAPLKFRNEHLKDSNHRKVLF